MKLQNSTKQVLNCFKLPVVFKSQNKFLDTFHFTLFPKSLPQVLFTNLIVDYLKNPIPEYVLNTLLQRVGKFKCV